LLNSYPEDIITTNLFKDNKGVFVRFGEQKYDDQEMMYYTEYYYLV
jgi:hypothetical protein